jgi:hypothetical protein
MAIALENGARQTRDEETRSRSLTRYRRTETIEFRIIFWAAFSAFFVAALIERLLPTQWVRRADGDQPRRSVVSQARHAANTCAAYALMG